MTYNEAITTLNIFEKKKRFLNDWMENKIHVYRSVSVEFLLDKFFFLFSYPVITVIFCLTLYIILYIYHIIYYDILIVHITYRILYYTLQDV